MAMGDSSSISITKRLCHFNQWSFALERWEPFVSESFPNTIPFWVCVTGVPIHFWNDQTFIAISKVLGKWISLESKRARFQVYVNVDMPLQFERRLEFSNGDIGRVSFSYEGLYRYFYTCHLISHDEAACPQLTPEKREQKRQQRAELNAHGEPGASRVRNDDRNVNMKQPRSPSNGRQSPPLGRQRSSTSNDYRNREKRPRLSPVHDNRATRPNQRHQEHNREPSNRNQSRNEDVCKRLELPPRTSSTYGNNTSQAPPRESRHSQRYSEPRQSAPYNRRQGNRYQDTRSWHPRSPPKPTQYSETAPASSRAPQL